MISCNPHSFCRDAQQLLAAGYVCDWLQMIDQFHLTPHTELVARFHAMMEQQHDAKIFCLYQRSCNINIAGARILGCLCALATAQNKAVAQLIAEIDTDSSRTSGGLSSAIRLHILNEMRQRLTLPPE
jgi:hypothetical protein